jgi:uncharacterized protein
MHLLHTPADAQQDKNARLLLAPGSMGAMDNPTLEFLSQAIARNGVNVSRFEFAYMAQRRTGGGKRPPPRAEKLVDEYTAAIAELMPQLAPGEKLLIGGKSLGGRVASMIADEQFAAGAIHGLVCFGYPFHPPKRPECLRTAHLRGLKCPTLVVQGERDPFGRPEEVDAYDLSEAIKLYWAPDGDHDLKPRRSSGTTHDSNLRAGAEAVARFAAQLTGKPR